MLDDDLAEEATDWGVLVEEPAAERAELALEEGTEWALVERADEMFEVVETGLLPLTCTDEIT